MSPPLPCDNRHMDEDERQLRQQLMLHEALVQAIDRRDEFFQVIQESKDTDDAIRRVGQLLGLSELGSRAVLDLQAKAFTQDRRQSLATFAEELRSRLPNGR